MTTLALLGFGTVGQGIARIIKEQYGDLDNTLKIKKALVHSLNKDRGPYARDIEFTTSIDDILNDQEIDIIVEVMGGETPTLSYIETALQNKKYVVTANKEVMAKHGQHLMTLAQNNGVSLLFEAAVGGGIPIIHTLANGFAANDIQAMFGILNGTTNYILTKIAENKESFDTVLKKAQDLGFAEADPTMDISGMDALYKLAILAHIGFKTIVNPKDIYCEGITDIDLKDIENAKDLGYVIKLLAIGKNDQHKNTITLKVHPTFIPATHPLASVRDEFNALYVIGNAVGESMLYGKGAGSLPTASAVVSDILRITQATIFPMSLMINPHKKEVHKIDESISQFYIRIKSPNDVGVLEKVSGILRKHTINILKIKQNVADDQNDADIVIVTQLVQEKQINAAIKELESSKYVHKVESRIRVGLEQFLTKL